MANDDHLVVQQLSEQLDVQLLDVMAQIEALLRRGRGIQRAALAVSGVPDPVSPEQRRQAGITVVEHIEEMRLECLGLSDVLAELARTSAELNRLLDGDDR